MYLTQNHLNPQMGQSHLYLIISSDMDRYIKNEPSAVIQDISLVS